ncbi:hypothetical protein [Mycolicibacterium helvum]|uniref:Uncharacterized protein n=1 Tax=Mycolicibacterium helvum TaxID=1534349 RepID=A0A7I7TEB6_9MYCO|nr:hypothetical protein [Mycolicibacterium helvum]BBY67557.1 hypothetical protein MHEL_58000 [Mycolicibacterium helvum]
MTEPELIAQHLAGSPWFPLSASGGPVAARESVAHVEVDGNAITIRVTDAVGAKREYQARVEPITGQCQHCTVPVDRGDTCAFCLDYVPPESPHVRQQD